jgi:hypothetical protein
MDGFLSHRSRLIDLWPLGNYGGWNDKYRNCSCRNQKVDEQKWSDILDRYQFSNVDEFDRELVRFVDSGVLDSAIISKAAVEQSEKLARLKKANTLEDSWKPLHVSFDDNLGEVTRSVVDGMKASLGVVSLSQLDSALGVLKE